MVTIAFKSEESFKKKLELLARSKGISLSAIIKLFLTEAVKRELIRIKEDGLTLMNEFEFVIESKKKKKIIEIQEYEALKQVLEVTSEYLQGKSKPFKNAKSLIRSLKN